MYEEPSLVASHRLLSLADKFHDKRYRDGYVAAHTRGVLARQMRNFRGEISQADYAAKIGKQKTVVGRLESPAYGGWSLRTMFEIARKEDVAVLVGFVDFPTFLGFTDDMSDETLHPHAYDQTEIDLFAAYQSGQISYYNLGASLNLNRGIATGPTIYGDVFSGQSVDLFPLVNVTSGNALALAKSNFGSALQIGGGTLSNLVWQAAAWTCAAPVFPTSAFHMYLPPTPGVLARANAEIGRLNGIIARQQQEIADLETRYTSLAQTKQVLPIIRPQSQVIQLRPAA